MPYNEFPETYQTRVRRSSGKWIMASATTSSAVKLEPYGDLIDLYAARTVRARTIPSSEPSAPMSVSLECRATTGRAATVALPT